MSANPVIWFEIYVKDMTRARKFYQNVFNNELTPMPSGPELEMFGFPMDMNKPGAGGALVRMQGFEPGANSVIVYFSSEDCSIEEKRIVNAGGRIQKPKMSIGQYGFISLAIDTEGNMIGIHSLK
jgi:predicted enzyme related to lactoylglutathione lyase